MSYAKIGLFEGFDSNFPTKRFPATYPHLQKKNKKNTWDDIIRGFFLPCLVLIIGGFAASLHLLRAGSVGRQWVGFSPSASLLGFRYIWVTWNICDAWPASCTARDQRLRCTALQTQRTCTVATRDGGKKSCSSRRRKCSQRASLWL